MGCLVCSPKWRLLLFKVPGVKSHQLLDPSGFQSQVLQGFVFPLQVFHAWGTWCRYLFPCSLYACCALPPGDSPKGPFGYQLTLCPTLLNMASLHLAVESLHCLISGHFLGYLY